MKFDLHIHSSYSRDGTASPRDVLGHCRKIGLAGFSIADHNQIEGTLEAAAISKEEGLLVLKAIEVSAAEGHVLAYGVRELVPRGLSVAETIERIHDAGGLAVAAHPVRFPSGVGLELAEGAKFDAIEVLNGGSSSRGNKKARRLAERKHSPVTAGSDAHKLDEIGKAYVEVEGVSTEDELLDAIRRGLTRPGGRSRSVSEGIVYSTETLFEWMSGSFRRL
jgi:predicted metal-dependent phosphoesterase TrpH